MSLLRPGEIPVQGALGVVTGLEGSTGFCLGEITWANAVAFLMNILMQGKCIRVGQIARMASV